jgi:hypothetical protein
MMFRQVYKQLREDHLFFIGWTPTIGDGHTKIKDGGWTYDRNDMKTSFKLELIS